MNFVALLNKNEFNWFLKFQIGYNQLQLLYREVKGILLYQEFPRPILST